MKFALVTFPDLMYPGRFGVPNFCTSHSKKLKYLPGDVEIKASEGN